MMRPQHPPLPPPRLPPPLPPREHAPATFSDDEAGSESASATSSPRDDLTEESGFNFGEDAELLVLLSRLRKMTGGEPQNTEQPEIISSTTRAKRSRLRPQSRSVIESSAFLRDGDDFIERWKRPAQRRGSVGEERLSHLHPARTVLLPRSPRADSSTGEKDYESGNEDDEGVAWVLNRGRSLSDTLQRIEQPAMITATIVGLKDKKKRNSLIRRPSWFGQERDTDGQLIFPLCSQLQGEFKKMKGIP